MSRESRFAFFRQSGWMMFAATAGGALMFLVHLVASRMPGAEWAVFNSLLSVYNILSIPSLGLGGVFAQQTAAAVTEEQRRRLVGTARAVLGGTFVMWLVMVAVMIFFQTELTRDLKVTNPLALWVTAGLGLTSMWLPVMSGILQGQQNFLWLGLSAIVNGAGRFISVVVVVLLCGGHSTSALCGALVGAVLSLALAAWHSRNVWVGIAEPFVAGAWLRRVVPLTLGLGASMFMLSYDVTVVQKFFTAEQAKLYGAACKIGFGLVLFTTPMTAVMFPKIVAAAAREQTTNVLAHALVVTALMGGAVAIVCTLFPEFTLRLIFPPHYLEVAWLVRWSVWAMLPLALGNVLLNNLLARERYATVPWLVLGAGGYALALRWWHESFLQVVQVLGVFNLLFFAVCAWFTWRGEQRAV